MAFILDDLLFLPGTVGKIILNTIAQTAEKVAWVEYSRELKKLLLKARHDYDNGKIDKGKFREIEGFVFKEMRIARHILKGE